MCFVRRYAKRHLPGQYKALNAYSLRMTPFYRTYWKGYDGNLKIDKMDHNSFYDEDLSVFFHRIPKVANSSLTASILTLTKENPGLLNQKEKRSYKKMSSKPSSMKSGTVKRFPSFFKFFFVRNPYTRVLSAFLSKVEHKVTHGMGHKVVPVENQDTRAFRKMLAEPTFDNFGRFLEADPANIYCKGEWSPQHDFVLLGVSAYDFMGRFENLNADFTLAANRILGNDSQYTVMPEDESHKTSANDKLKKYYSTYMEGVVAEIYEKDFEEFGYDKKLV